MSWAGAFYIWITAGPFLLLGFALRFPAYFFCTVAAAVILTALAMRLVLFHSPWKQAACFLVGGYVVLFINGDDGKVTERLTLPVASHFNETGLFRVADAVTGQATVSHVVGSDWIVQFDPQNGPDGMQLLNPQGALVDALGYGVLPMRVAENGLACVNGEPAVDVPSGSYLQRKEKGIDLQNNAGDFIEVKP